MYVLFPLQQISLTFFFHFFNPQGHSQYPSEDCYSTPQHDVEGGETEKLQQNGEANNLALGKVDAGEGELMLSPAQTPQVKFLCCPPHYYHLLSLVWDVLLH